MIDRLLARLACWRYGHKRGKRVSDTHVACPRCTEQWPLTKKVKAA